MLWFRLSANESISSPKSWVIINSFLSLNLSIQTALSLIQSPTCISLTSHCLNSIQYHFLADCSVLLPYTPLTTWKSVTFSHTAHIMPFNFSAPCLLQDKAFSLQFFLCYPVSSLPPHLEQEPHLPTYLVTDQVLSCLHAFAHSVTQTELWFILPDQIQRLLSLWCLFYF